MTVAVLCEYSGRVRDAFTARGHYATSCDLLPSETRGSHYQGNFKDFRWNQDLVIAFPPCTDLAVSGARHFERKRLDGSQEQSINLFIDVWQISDVVENPVNIMCGLTYIKKWFPHIYQRLFDLGFPLKPSQIIQPWQFGHGETKKTCLWITDQRVPLLRPTNIVSGREARIHRLPPSADRGKLRSITYQGIANAMAEQWG